jgi:hypothetical protein
VLDSFTRTVYLKWMMAPLDPRWIQAMMAPLNPNLYMGWLGASINPSSYGDLWKGFLTYPAPTAAPAGALAPATPWPATGYGAAPTVNLFDPNSWAQMFAVPGAAPAGSPPATTPYIFNPLDPNAWSKLLTVPAPAAPAVK